MVCYSKLRIHVLGGYNIYFWANSRGAVIVAPLCKLLSLCNSRTVVDDIRQLLYGSKRDSLEEEALEKYNSKALMEAYPAIALILDKKRKTIKKTKPLCFYKKLNQNELYGTQVRVFKAFENVL